MILAAGARLSHYQIVAPLGAGGMGEVYRARDPRIGREVALKILPRAFAENADRLRRFTQEAQTAGALNHPNLLTIFDIGTENGTPFIVSELLEGQTLRERGTVTQRKALEYATQIASGLAAAHDRGIVHRDLKPENIFITTDDRIKLLDFGLAKLLSDPAAAENQSKTVERLTDPGMVMGTASYMSPEQVRGQAVDHRSDIFSFGTVVLEMLGGVNPFQRPSQIDTMNAILHDDPSLPPSIPPGLQRVLLHALEKDPAQRFQSVKDVRFALETLSGSGESASVPTRGRREKKAEAAKPIQFTAVTFRRGFVMTARFARDGSVVYGAAWEDQPVELFASFPGDPHARALGAAGVDLLSVSPVTGELAVSLGRRFQGGWVTSGTLARLPASGGAAREVAEDVQDADWSPDGKTLAVIRRSGDVYGLDYPLGNRVHTTSHWISDVRISPKGDRIAFLDHPLWGDDGGSVVVVDLRGEKLLQSSHWRSTSGLAWTPKSDEVWVGTDHHGSGRSVIAVSLSGKERRVLALPARVTVHDFRRDGALLMSSQSGRREIVAGRRGVPGERNLSWCDWSFLGDISADGSRVVLVEQAAAARGTLGGIYVRKVDGSPAVHLGDGHARTISPDGKWVAAMTSGPDHLDLLPVGAGESKTVPVRGLEMMVWWNWFPDGRRLLVWGNEPDRGSRMFEVALDGDGLVRPIGPEGVKWPVAIAPDSRHVAVTGPDERLMIYAMDGDAEPREVAGSRRGDQALRWGDDNALYVYQFGRVRTAIERIDLSSGARTEWQELKPTDPAGVMNIQPVVLSADGESYAYGFRRFMSELHVVTGLL